MSARPVLRGACIGVRFTHRDHVFLSVPVVHVLQVTMIEIINMVPMLNGGVSAAGAMDVRRCVGTSIGGRHRFGFPLARCRSR
jgi:hypothetical protein